MKTGRCKEQRRRVGFPARLLALLLMAGPGLAGAEAPLVATLHPILSEMVTRIAGDHVRIEELLGPGGNPHTFDPSPRDLGRIQEAKLVVAMGKNLEGYLDRLREALPSDARFYEAGRLVPSLLIDVEDEVFMCCPSHSHGALDPHWWQSPRAARTAVRHLGRELEELLPEHRGEIRANTREYMRELEELHEWVESQVTRIPRGHRKLVTAHAAFGYFCDEYGFQSIPVQGLTPERDPTPGYLRETVEIIRRERVRAVFPEADASPKLLEMIREETGVVLADPLHADNTHEEGMTYGEMIRSNVRSMVAGLTETSEDGG